MTSAELLDKIPCITYKQLKLATNNWSNHNILGFGGFSIVYKGTLNKTKIAVKRIKIINFENVNDPSVSNYGPLTQLLNEINILKSVSHKNIIRLLAFSIEEKMSCLVYPLMINGSVKDRLLLKDNRRKALSWSERYKIAKGVGQGLLYLHTLHGQAIIHGDIKSANILLDCKLEAKISDFGLSRIGFKKQLLKVSKPRGTQSYMPNEYIYGNNLSTKVDSYAYGIVLFELATGLLAYDKSRPVDKLLRDFVWSNIDYRLYSLKDTQAGEDNYEIFNLLINIGKCCTNNIVTLRHDMTSVAKMFDQFDSIEKFDDVFKETGKNVFAVLNQIDF